MSILGNYVLLYFTCRAFSLAVSYWCYWVSTNPSVCLLKDLFSQMKLRLCFSLKTPGPRGFFALTSLYSTGLIGVKWSLLVFFILAFRVVFGATTALFTRSTLLRKLAFFSLMVLYFLSVKMRPRLLSRVEQMLSPIRAGKLAKASVPFLCAGNLDICTSSGFTFKGAGMPGCVVSLLNL